MPRRRAASRGRRSPLRSREVARGVGALAACLCACGQRFPALTTRQVEAGLGAAARVRPEIVAQHVQRIHALRLQDRELSFDYSAWCPVPDCRYSRDATRRYAEEVWGASSGLPAPPERHTVERQGLTTTNLVLDLPASSGSDEWVLATAHYDAWFGAANDNASGVAVTLEAAFALAQLPRDRNIRLVLTDGEELGMVGSTRYIEDFGTQGITVALNADMVAHVGDAGSALSREPAGTEYIAQANESSAAQAFQLADLASQLPEPLALRAVVFPGDGLSVLGFAVGWALSDHAPFWQAGVPAIFPFPAGEKPAWYHTADDTPDRVDADRLARFARLWAAAVAAFATDSG